jgi:hypothetical protein
MYSYKEVEDGTGQSKNGVNEHTGLSATNAQSYNKSTKLQEDSDNMTSRQACGLFCLGVAGIVGSVAGTAGAGAVVTLLSSSLGNGALSALGVNVASSAVAKSAALGGAMLGPFAGCGIGAKMNGCPGDQAKDFTVTRCLTDAATLTVFSTGGATVGALTLGASVAPVVAVTATGAVCLGAALPGVKKVLEMTR